MRGLRYHRRQADMTQAEVARHLGLSQSHYSKIENGVCSAKTHQLVKLAQLFDVTVDELL